LTGGNSTFDKELGLHGTDQAFRWAKFATSRSGENKEGRI